MTTQDMNRRNFLRTMIGGLAAGAAVRTWPFRVFSFPSEIVKPQLVKITMQQNFKCIYEVMYSIRFGLGMGGTRIKQFHPRCTVKLWTQHQGKTVRIRATKPQDEMWLGGNPECGAAQYAVIHPEDLFDPRVNSLCEHQFLTD